MPGYFVKSDSYGMPVNLGALNWQSNKEGRSSPEWPIPEVRGKQLNHWHIHRGQVST